MKNYSLISYLFIAGIITVIFAVIYVSVQQSYRSGANDPQIQIARDINAKLQNNKPVDPFFTDSINIATSLSSFAVLYNAGGKPLRSSGFLNGKMPELPAGVFDFVKANGEHEVTWQPQKDVRIAMIIISTNSSAGFIAAGRSLQEVEMREHNLVVTIFIGWIVCIGLVLLHTVLQFYKKIYNKI